MVLKDPITDSEAKGYNTNGGAISITHSEFSSQIQLSGNKAWGGSGKFSGGGAINLRGKCKLRLIDTDFATTNWAKTGNGHDIYYRSGELEDNVDIVNSAARAGHLIMRWTQESVGEQFSCDSRG